MPPRCSEDSLPHHCAGKFEEISHALGKIGGIADDVATLRRAVVGNGRTEESLAFRVSKLEGAASSRKGSRRKWGERVWKVAVAVGLVLFGYWIKS